MTATEIAVRLVMAVIASAIGAKFGLRKRADDWFASLKLDWVSGIGLAFAILAAWLIFGLMVLR